jgi:Helicase conserved C-terminal domain
MTTTDVLPPLLDCQTSRRIPEHLDPGNLSELRKVARVWLDPVRSKLPRESLVKALRCAFEDDETAGRVLASLAPPERAAVAAYRRYGGTVDGEVIRLDLTARGLLEVVEKRHSDYYTMREWKHNPLKVLLDRGVLLLGDTSRGYNPSYWSYFRPDQPLPTGSLHAGVARRVEPAGPARWSSPLAEGTPQDVARRAPAEVAIDLSRVFAFVAERGTVKTRKDGVLAAPTLRALEKALPQADDSEYVLPERHALYFELLRGAAAIVVEGNEARVDPTAAHRLFARAGVWQAHSWARGWLTTRHWFDGAGTPEAGEMDDVPGHVRTGRQIVAWALGCLAHAGDDWYDLNGFLAAIHDLQGGSRVHLPYTGQAWDPRLPGAAGKEAQNGPERQRAWWFSREGAWYANAVMVTLVTLGLVERGRVGRGKSAGLAFRLTAHGRAVFGAPEVALPADPVEGRFLLIQPNFDVIAYLDRADAPSAAMLGRLAAGDAVCSGLVQTFRITQMSVYQAQESGLSQAQIVEFLRCHSQRELPANVVQAISDWSRKRERLTLRSGVSVLGFASTDERDAYLKRHPGAGCGARFVVVTDRDQGRATGSKALLSDHLTGGRRTLELDEEGRILSTRPVDIVQRARLARLARPTGNGWQLTSDSVRRAAAAGLKPAQIYRWLEEHLASPMPPLIEQAIDAWLGVGRPLELAEAVLLHVPDEERFRAIAHSDRLRPFLLGSPGLHWLAVKRDSRAKLASVLRELGFVVGDHLTHEGLAAPGGVGRDATE